MRSRTAWSVPASVLTVAAFLVSCGEGPTRSLTNVPGPDFAKPGACPGHPSCKDDGDGGGGNGKGNGEGGGKATFDLVFSGHITGGKAAVSLKADDPFKQVKEGSGVVLQLVDAVDNGTTCDEQGHGPTADDWGPYSFGDWSGSLEIAKRGGSLSRFQFVGDQPDGGHVNIVLSGGSVTELRDVPEAGDVTVEYRNVCAKTSNTSDPGAEGEDTDDRVLNFDVVADRI